jgi:hypothetical protein
MLRKVLLMKKAMRDHLYAYGCFLGFLTRYGQLSDGMQEREPSVDFLALDLSCSSCFSFCTRDCQQYQLFNAGWQEGVAQVVKKIMKGKEDL